MSAMLINCLGFTSRPLTLTPQFFESKAVTGLDQLKAKTINLFSEKIVVFDLFGKNTKSCKEKCAQCK